MEVEPPSVPTQGPALLRSYRWHMAVPGGDHQAESSSVPPGTQRRGRLQGWKRSWSQPEAEVPEEAAGKGSWVPGKAGSRRSLFQRAFSAPSTKGWREPRGHEVGKGTLQRYLRGMAKKKVAGGGSAKVEQEVPDGAAASTQGTSMPTLLAPMPDAQVWDISNFSLVDGHLVLVGTNQEASCRGRNQAESSEGTNLHPTEAAVDEKGTEGTMRGTESETSSTSQFSNVKGLLWKRLRERRGRSAHRAVPPAVPVPNGDRVPSCSGSHESLVPVPRVTQLDLSGHSLIVRPVHGSIVGEKFCFQIITGEGSSTFGCSSLAERERWIENLRRSAQPNKDNRERLELSLTLCVYEGRELPPRRRLRCQLHLDGLLFARTTAKVPGPDGDLFWGELFQLPSLPPSQTLTLSLCRDDLPATQPALASVAIPLSELAGTKQPLERWYPLSGASGQRAPALRLRGRYREVKVLPIVCYKELAEFITFHYRELCARLEPAIAARHKEELASALVRVLQSTGKAKAFLIDLGVAELDRCHACQALIFRENTLAAKAIEEYMKLVGAKYLQDTLGEAVAQLCQSDQSCEVDPSRCPNLDLVGNQTNLRQLCQDILGRIATSCGSFPSELSEVFSAWQEECQARGLAPMGHRLVSASLFLRFLCPAIMSPSLFSLAQQYPSEGTARTLTLVAKVIQNLANFTTFGEKEAYMGFMNDFLAHNLGTMGHFLQAVADPDSGAHLGTYDAHLDLALELATLHLLLCDIFASLDQATQEELEPLPTILKAIKEGTPVPVSVRLSSTTQPSLRLARSREDSPDPPPPPCPPPCPPPLAPTGHRRQVKRAQSVPAQPKASRCHPRDLLVPAAEDDLGSKGRGKLRASASLPRKSAVPWQRQGEERAAAGLAQEGIVGTAALEKGRWVEALRQEVQQCQEEVQKVGARLAQLEAEQLQRLQQQLEEANARAHNLGARLTAAEGSRRKDLERLRSSEERTRELESRLAALEQEQEQLRDAICRARGQGGCQGSGLAPRGWAEGGEEAQATSV